ncbi:MAG: hypothetical protein LKE37_08820 [Atopobiaceae bacterium]|jgi:hypothetical protein|nr:hypothetical protein [Atopobiaceae bacterium]
MVELAVRAAVSDGPGEHMDSLDRTGLRAELRAMRDERAGSGWAAASAGLSSDPAGYDEETDLSACDAATGIGR